MSTPNLPDGPERESQAPWTSHALRHATSLGPDETVTVSFNQSLTISRSSNYKPKSRWLIVARAAAKFCLERLPFIGKPIAAFNRWKTKVLADTPNPNGE